MEEMRIVDGSAAGAVGRVSVGDVAELYRDRADEMVRLGWLLTSSPEVAHDICHDAFAAIHRRWDDVDDHLAYLRRCVVNGAADHHRRRGRERAALDRLGPSPSAEEAGDEYLADLIAGLPFRQQSVVVLRFWCGMTEREIAAAVGCRPGTVGPTLHRALKQLRTALALDEEEDPS